MATRASGGAPDACPLRHEGDGTLSLGSGRPRTAASRGHVAAFHVILATARSLPARRALLLAHRARPQCGPVIVLPGVREASTKTPRRRLRAVEGDAPSDRAVALRTEPHEVSLHPGGLPSLSRAHRTDQRRRRMRRPTRFRTRNIATPSRSRRPGSRAHRRLRASSPAVSGGGSSSHIKSPRNTMPSTLRPSYNSARKGVGGTRRGTALPVPAETSDAAPDGLRFDG